VKPAANELKLILKIRNVVPKLLLTGVFSRHVVPELLFWQQQRDDVVARTPD
jgi:hypothetical protein